MAPNDGSEWGHLSDAELLKKTALELARRRVARGEVDLEAAESFAEDVKRDLGEDTLAATIEALPPEPQKPKPCPRCGEPAQVKARNRVRHLRTLAGELRFSRNYHYCKQCKEGFYPRDRELKLPEAGEVSDAVERRILDFGVNGAFLEAAERWGIHSPEPISEHSQPRGARPPHGHWPSG